jgi:hypothetical protein
MRCLFCDRKLSLPCGRPAPLAEPVLLAKACSTKRLSDENRLTFCKAIASGRIQMMSNQENRCFDPRRTALLAYQFWLARGRPEGSPDQDWFMAEEQLRHQQGLHLAQAA